MEKDIYDLLKKAHAEKSSLRLHNLYKGVPVTNDAEVLGVDKESIHLRVNQYQVACIYLERGTFIQGQGSPFPLRAQLSKLDLERGDVTLTNVVKTQGGTGLRGQVRVEPQDPIWVYLQMRNALSPVTSRMADLSLTGLCVTMERFYFQPHIYRVGAQLKVDFDLPRMVDQSNPDGLDMPDFDPGSLETRFSRDQLSEQIDGASLERNSDRTLGSQEEIYRISSDAVVVHFRPELYLDRYRIGLRLINDETSRKILWRYISQRQAELIQEFRQVYDALRLKRLSPLS